MIGTTLGHFRITARLGAGGMGEVYRARDERLDRDVALKVLPGEVAHDEARLARFEREARTLARLSHPNIVSIHEFGEDRGIAFAVMELLDGQTLRGRIDRGALPWREAVEIGAAVADALDAAHGRGVIHRDLKPDNVFLTAAGPVKLLDFGLARTADPPAAADAATSPGTRTIAGTLLGTIGYMSPEQVRAETLDPRSDIFSLGCLLYEALSGHRAFSGRTPADVLSAILTATPPALADPALAVPPALSAIVARALEKSPRSRFQSAADLAFALRALLPNPATPAPAESVEIHAAADRRPAVAVLPFANLSADREQEFFCDGMAEEIINALAQVQGLRVVARTSAFAFKGRHDDVRNIGRSLDVGAIVEGSVRKAGDRIRITAQLIDVRNGSHLWSQRFDHRLEDVFAIQEEISLAIVDSLEVALLGRERTAIVKRYTDDLDAYSAYLRGAHHWHELTPSGYEQSRRCYEEAIRINPAYGRAYARLAIWYLSQSWWGAMSGREALAAAEPLVERARQLDSSISEIPMLQGVAAFIARDWERAEKGFVAGIEAAPSSVEAHGNSAVLLLVRGRFEEALREARLAHKLDPLSPTWSSWTCTWLAWAGALEDAIPALQRVVEMHPHHWVPHNELSGLFASTGRIDEAIAEAGKAVELSGGVTPALAQLASFCYLRGQASRGDALLQTLLERSHTSYVPPTRLAWIHMARGDTDEALARFHEAFRSLDPALPFHRFVARGLASDSRIDALIAGMNL